MNTFEFESWKPIEGYEHFYSVSNYGRVKRNAFVLAYKDGRNRKYKEHILPIQYNQITNRCYVHLKKDLKQLSVLVGKAFIPNPYKLPEINHRDENTHNNCVWNLEWCTRAYNLSYGTAKNRMRKSLMENSPKNKQVLCVETNTLYKSTRDIERKLGFNHSTISKACRLNKIAYNYHWKYAA